MVDQVQWAQKLHREILRATGRDGIRVTFGVLADGRCAVVHGAVTDVWAPNARGIAAATDRFAALTAPPDPTSTPTTTTTTPPRLDVLRDPGDVTRAIPHLP